MKRIIILLLSIAGASLYQFDSLPKETKPIINPQPKQINSGNITAFVESCNFNIDIYTLKNDSYTRTDTLYEIIDKYLRWKVFLNGDGCDTMNVTGTQDHDNLKGVTVYKNLIVYLNGTSSIILSPLEEADESYNITINETQEDIIIEANQYEGVMRALSSLAYLIKSSNSNRYGYQVDFVPIQIHDSPRYVYRGLMLDTSRAFYSVKSIKQVLDVMSLAKMNVFHWHIVDDDSFPLQLESYPNVTANGAFSSSQVYKKQDILDIVVYAQHMAIRVVPEFDNPGHVRAVGTDPEFTDAVRCFNTDLAFPVPNAYTVRGGPPTATFDPSYDKVYEVIKGILTDLDILFPERMIHLGGDEVDQTCFDENPNLKTWMTEHNIATYSDLVVYHQAKARQILTEIKDTKVGVYWSNPDTFYQKYQDGDILVYWGSKDNLDEMKKTYPNQRYVLAPYDYYYLDCGYGNKYGGNSWCDPFHTFWGIYSFEPSDYITGDAVLGGEVAAWSEMFRDHNIHTRIWPRASAMSDKLWGPLVDTDLVGLSKRQMALEKKINSMGIPTSPITGVWCEVNADHCFAEHQPSEDVIAFE